MTPGRPPADAGNKDDRLNPVVTFDGTNAATGAAWASTTRSTYATQWGRFQAWCEERQLAPLDASPEQVAAYLRERAKRGKLSTVKLSAAAISAGYRAAGRLDPTMKRVIAEARRGIEQQKETEPGLVASACRRHRPRNGRGADAGGEPAPAARQGSREGSHGRSTRSTGRGDHRSGVSAPGSAGPRSPPSCGGTSRPPRATTGWRFVCGSRRRTLRLDRGRLPAAGRRIRTGGRGAT